MQRVRFLIVGGGVAGLATAWALARRGLREVLLVEREPALATHSSGRNAAILRTFTGEASATELALRTAAFLAAPPADFAREPLRAGGLVLVPDPAQSAALGEWRARKPHGSVAELDDDGWRACAPLWRGARAGALLVRDEGHFDTLALLAGLAAGARAGGAEIRTGAAVRELALEAGRCTGARLASGELVRADCTVLAAGAWCGVLADAAGSRVRLAPTRRHLLATAPVAGIDPRAPVVWSDPDGFYARPERGGMLLCACDESAGDPERYTTDEAVRTLIEAQAAHLLPALAAAGAARFWCGLRTFAADREFLVGPDPDVEGLAWAAGLGGHGMSTSVALGELAARVLAGDARERELDPLARALDPARTLASAEA